MKLPDSYHTYGHLSRYPLLDSYKIHFGKYKIDVLHFSKINKTSMCVFRFELSFLSELVKFPANICFPSKVVYNFTYLFACPCLMLAVHRIIIRVRRS